MAFENWEKDKQGNISVYPVAGWDSFIPFQMMCGVRVHYVTHPAAMDTKERQYLPLIMTPIQARELAGLLTRLADKAEHRSQEERDN